MEYDTVEYAEYAKGPPLGQDPQIKGHSNPLYCPGGELSGALHC